MTDSRDGGLEPRRASRRRPGPRPGYLDPEVLQRAADAGDERLQVRAAREKSERPGFLTQETLDQVVEEHTKFFKELAGRRVDDFQVICDERNNPPESIDNNYLVVDIVSRVPPTIITIEIDKSRAISELGRELLLELYYSDTSDSNNE